MKLFERYPRPWRAGGTADYKILDADGKDVVLLISPTTGLTNLIVSCVNTVGIAQPEEIA